MQENTAQDPAKTMEKPEPRPAEKLPTPADKPIPSKAAKTPVVPVATSPVTPSPWLTLPSFTKTPPNELYRRLLPAVLFVLTFVTVMTILLIYMDTVAVGAQQFRVNMTRDYELARIGQASAALVAYVRQLHLAPRAPPKLPPPAEPTPQVRVLDALYGEIYNGTFVEWWSSGPRSRSTWYLEAARGWDGAVVRAAPRDFLALRGASRALHACLSAAPHPREVTYQEPGGAGEAGAASVFRSRVLCLPLYTVLLAAGATRADLLQLAGDNVLPALTHLPYGDGDLHVQNIEIIFTDPVTRNKTTEFLLTKNYTVAATFDDSIMYALKGDLNSV